MLECGLKPRTVGAADEAGVPFLPASELGECASAGHRRGRLQGRALLGGGVHALAELLFGSVLSAPLIVDALLLVARENPLSPFVALARTCDHRDDTQRNAVKVLAVAAKFGSSHFPHHQELLQQFEDLDASSPVLFAASGV